MYNRRISVTSTGRMFCLWSDVWIQCGSKVNSAPAVILYQSSRMRGYRKYLKKEKKNVSSILLLLSPTLGNYQ